MLAIDCLYTVSERVNVPAVSALALVVLIAMIPDCCDGSLLSSYPDSF